MDIAKFWLAIIVSIAVVAGTIFLSVTLAEIKTELKLKRHMTPITPMRVDGRGI